MSIIEHMPAKSHNDIISNSVGHPSLHPRGCVPWQRVQGCNLESWEKSPGSAIFKFRSGSMSRIDTMNSETAISYNQTIIDAFLACSIEDDGTVREKSSRALFLGESDSANENWSCHILSSLNSGDVLEKFSARHSNVFHPGSGKKLSGRRGKVGLRTLIDEWHACAILCPWKTGLRETSKWNRWSFRSLKPDLQWRTKAQHDWGFMELFHFAAKGLEYVGMLPSEFCNWCCNMTCFDVFWHALTFVAAVDFPKKKSWRTPRLEQLYNSFFEHPLVPQHIQSHKSQYDSSHHALGASQSSQSSDRCHCLELIALNVFS